MALLGGRALDAQDKYIVEMIELIAASSPTRREELERWIAAAEKT